MGTSDKAVLVAVASWLDAVKQRRSSDALAQLLDASKGLHERLGSWNRALAVAGDSTVRESVRRAIQQSVAVGMLHGAMQGHGYGTLDSRYSAGNWQWLANRYLALVSSPVLGELASKNTGHVLGHVLGIAKPEQDSADSSK